MSRLTAILLIPAALAACSANPAPTTTAAVCSGTRILTVTNGGDEGVIVYALNGRTSTEIGAVPQGKKELVIPPNVRATSFYAAGLSRLQVGGSITTAPTDTRVTFVEECRPKP